MPFEGVDRFDDDRCLLTGWQAQQIGDRLVDRSLQVSVEWAVLFAAAAPVIGSQQFDRAAAAADSEPLGALVIERQVGSEVHRVGGVVVHGLDDADVGQRPQQVNFESRVHRVQPLRIGSLDGAPVLLNDGRRRARLAGAGHLRRREQQRDELNGDRGSFADHLKRGHRVLP